MIDRDNVTLRGADPMTDGVRGAAPPPGATAIYIKGADSVRLEGLAILAGNQHGVSIDRAGVVGIFDSRILDHPLYGARAESTRLLVIQDTVITGAGVYALITAYVKITRVRGSVFEGAEAGVNPGLSGVVFITNSVVTSASIGVLSELAWISLYNTDVDAPTVLQAVRGDIHMSGGGLGSGYIVGAQKSSISLADVTQAANGPGAVLSSDSLLHLSGTTTVAGTMQMLGFSNLWIEGTSTVDGNLSCESGGDATVPPRRV